jgi:hypothetical protein
VTSGASYRDRSEINNERSASSLANRHAKRTDLPRPAGTMTGVTTFVVGFIVGASVVALLTIVIAPSRRVRSEQAMPREDVTRLLLGQNPDEPTIPPATSDEHPRSYDPKELQALRNIGQSRAGGRRRR